MGDALDPIDLGTKGTAVFVAVGGSHSCVLMVSGGVSGWEGGQGIAPRFIFIGG